jgi:hypothetical protein
VSCVDWRNPESLLRWCRASVVAAGAIGASGCVEWVQGVDWPSVGGPVTVPDERASSQLAPGDCERYCPREYGSASSCHVATLAIERRTAAPVEVKVPALGSTVVVCETSDSGHWESHSLSPFMQFGRRPRELLPTAGLPHWPGTAREYFEHAAFHEAAAVSAFQQLALDLEGLEAPAYLVLAARRAARDEAKHARWTLELARSVGGSGAARTARARLQRSRPRQVTAFELALENAAAGCVGETFGTWLQVFQARSAPQACVQATAWRIAKDEARHAALAFRLFDWLERRLGKDERERVRATMERESVQIDCRSSLPLALAVHLGLPSERQRVQAAREIAQQLAAVCA